MFWLKPECSYAKVSNWLQSLGYQSLQLDDNYWLTQVGGGEIIDNYKSGEHNYQAVIELVNQSNSPQLTAVLRYSDLKLKRN